MRRAQPESATGNKSEVRSRILSLTQAKPVGSGAAQVGRLSDESSMFRSAGLRESADGVGESAYSDGLAEAPTAGLAALESLLGSSDVEEVWLNGPSRIFASIKGDHRSLGIRLVQDDLEDLIERLLSSSGRRLDRSSPFVDARLDDGSRLHAAIPPVAAEWSVNIRRFVGMRAHHLDELAAARSVSPAAAGFLEKSIQLGLNTVVAGGVGAGKTTLLNCLASAIPSDQRVVTCEEVFELQLDLPDVAALQCRQPNVEGGGEVTLRRLVKESLRMRPDRLIVGEVRGAEALDMLLAMNAGCAAMTSIHANSARDALRKLVTLPLLAGENVSRDFVEPTVANCVDLVVFCHREPGGGERWVSEILGISEQIGDGGISASPIYSRVDGRLEWTGEYPRARHLFEAAGVELTALLSGHVGGEES